MASNFQLRRPSNALAKLYDINCKWRCALKIGLSENFASKIKESQLVKTSHGRKTLDVFDDPSTQRKYQAILNDVIVSIFDDPSDQEIFRKGLEGMERNYPEVLSGEQKHLVMCPSAFNYDSRIEPTESSVPKRFEERKAELETIPNRTAQEQKDLEDINEYLTRILPQITEGEVFTAFEKFFYPNRGIFIHSLKLDNHLKVFIDKARHERNQIKDTGFKLTPLEERIAEALITG